MLGTPDHSLLVEVFCVEKYSPLTQGNYRYKIFNTGWGMNYHALYVVEDDCLIYPMSFLQVPYKAFTYHFFSSLFSLAIIKGTIDEFYKLHDEKLLAHEGVTKTLLFGSSYCQQQYGTCAYSCTEAWVRSPLTPEQNKHITAIKLQVAANKLQQAVAIREIWVAERTELDWIGGLW